MIRVCLHSTVVAIGIYPSTGLSLMWLQDNVARHYKRAAMVGLTLSFANTAGVTVGQIFTTSTAPRYIRGLSISLGLAALALIIVIILMVTMPAVNKRREAKIAKAEQEGKPLVSCPERGDYDVFFRYSI